MSQRQSNQGHRQLEHTADLAIELWAPNEAALLVEGARAVVELMTEAAQLSAKQNRTLELDAVDAEDRLVRWLNEVLWLAIGEGFLVVDADLVLKDGGLSATVRGEPEAGDHIRSELKSATYHDLHLEQSADGLYRARVVIDV